MPSFFIFYFLVCLYYLKLQIYKIIVVIKLEILKCESQSEGLENLHSEAHHDWKF